MTSSLGRTRKPSLLALGRQGSWPSSLLEPTPTLAARSGSARPIPGRFARSGRRLHPSARSPGRPGRTDEKVEAGAVRADPPCRDVETNSTWKILEATRKRINLGMQAVWLIHWTSNESPYKQSTVSIHTVSISRRNHRPTNISQPPATRFQPHNVTRHHHHADV